MLSSDVKPNRRWKAVESKDSNSVMTTKEACHYLRISRPTYLKYIYIGEIRGAKAGRGWKVLKSELDRFLKGESRYSVSHSVSLPDRKESEGEIC
jgi:excisionase family DNA binding protein